MTMPPRHPRAPRQRRRRTAATTATVALLALTSSSLVLKPVRAAASADNANGGAQSGRLQLPPLHYSADLSFRGVLDGGKLEGFDISGHASGLPGNHDFLRLVPANPMAHGALFSQRKMEAEEWVAEIAFRVHGPPTVGIVEVVGDDGETRTTKVHKGGRGLAFWYSKSGSPGPVTISSDPKVVVSVPPPVIPGSPTDVSDPNVSLFGYRTQFDGLGIVFDTSPNSPLYLRSDSRNWEIKDTSSVGMGVGTSGVVSGILDDGTGSWIEPKGRVMKEDDEAAYLDKAVGECEAAFRNAQGLLWARVSYINQTIRVDLDLAPHTTLAKAGRDYAHNCFTLPGIKLTPGNYFGLTGLASGNAEPDSVDVYAMDVFEVVKVKEGTAPPPATSDEPPEERQPHILEGTVEDAVSSLAHEIFLSQARMVEAIDALARRVETLARHMGQGRGPVRQREGVPETGSNVALLNRLAVIETKLTDIAARSTSSSSTGGEEAGDTDTVKHILQLQDRLMVELKAFGRKLDSANGQSVGTLGTLSSRTAESLQLLQRAVATIDQAAASGKFSWLWYSASVGAAWIAAWVMRGRKENSFGKKMI